MVVRNIKIRQNKSHSAGFEPARAEPNWFLVNRLNHSATNAYTISQSFITQQRIVLVDLPWGFESSHIVPELHVIYLYFYVVLTIGPTTGTIQTQSPNLVGAKLRQQHRGSATLQAVNPPAYTLANKSRQSQLLTSPYHGKYRSVCCVYFGDQGFKSPI